jgi:triacylglycerol lipase
MKRLALCVLLLSAVPGSVTAADCVVLLHGLGRTSASMDTMYDALREAGFLAVNVDYPSRDYPIAKLAQMAVTEGLEGCRAMPDATKIDFVTHSLGGILVRQYLSGTAIPELGRVVMLAPPNQGSEVADELAGMPGYDWFAGPAGKQLGKGQESVPLALGPADFELGVIAGDRSIDPVGSAILDDPDDGKVSVADTRLEGMDDFVVVAHSHAFIMSMSDTIELTIRFLETGHFAAATAD